MSQRMSERDRIKQIADYLTEPRTLHEISAHLGLVKGTVYPIMRKYPSVFQYIPRGSTRRFPGSAPAYVWVWIVDKAELGKTLK